MIWHGDVMILVSGDMMILVRLEQVLESSLLLKECGSNLFPDIIPFVGQ